MSIVEVAKPALRIAIYYFIFCTIYIYSSDAILNSMITEKETISAIQTYKGIVFVFLTSVFLYLIIFQYLKKLRVKVEEEQALKDQIIENQRSFENLFINNPNPMWIYDQSTLKFIEVNYAAVLKYGYSQEEFKSMTLRDIRPESEVEKLENNIKSIHSTYQVSGGWKHKTKSGDEIDVEIMSHSINYNGVKARHVIALDVTQKVKLMNDLIEAKEKAEELNLLKNNFLSNMSHELRTPMIGILGFSQLLQDENNIQEVKEVSKILNESGKRLLHTLNSLIDLSELKFGNYKVTYQSFDVCKIINDIVESYHEKASVKSLQLKFEAPNDNFEVFSDLKLVESILNNLLDNAIKFTLKGSINISVNKSFKQNIECFNIEVSDTGIGIPEDKINLVFEEFRQVSEGLSRDFDGNGIGLALSREYAMKLGGEIKIESTQGKGSKFEFILPLIYNEETDGIR